MLDRNKTLLTHRLTHQASLWLDGKGFKPVEVEVPVARGWVADVGGIIYPTRTELIGLRLIKNPPLHYLHTTDGSYKENPKHQEWEIAYRSIPKPLTAVIEVKTSRDDFIHDKKWMREWPVNLCYVAIPDGMVDRSLWPAGWGVLLFSKEGTVLRRTFPPRVEDIPIYQQFHTVLSLAMRQYNRIRYGHLKEWQQKMTLNQGHTTTLSRMSSVLSFVEAVLRGGDITDTKAGYGIKAEIPEYLERRLKRLQATFRDNSVPGK